MKKQILFLLLLGLTSIQSLFATDVFSKMNPDQVCVAYKTTKGMFYVADVDVIGFNCAVQIEKSEPMIRVTIPVQKFDSGNSKRDSEVALILGDSEMIPLRFELLIPKELTQNSIPKTIVGKLFVKEKAKDVTLHLSQTTNVIRFQVNTKFSTIGVTVNSVGPGGLIAKPQDDLILYGQISNKIIFKSEK